jgi:hypothetical protein
VVLIRAIRWFKRWTLSNGVYVGWRGCNFVRRWSIVAPSGRGLRIHHFLPSTVEFTAHDHPWAFVTLVLRGGYVDITSRNGQELARDKVRAPGIRYRDRHHEHRTITGPEGAWTVVINGPTLRTWGFWSAAGQWLPWRAYHALGMRAACESPEPDRWPDEVGAPAAPNVGAETR